MSTSGAPPPFGLPQPLAAQPFGVAGAVAWTALGSALPAPATPMAAWSAASPLWAHYLGAPPIGGASPSP